MNLSTIGGTCKGANLLLGTIKRLLGTVTFVSLLATVVSMTIPPLWLVVAVTGPVTLVSGILSLLLVFVIAHETIIGHEGGEIGRWRRR